MSGTRVLFGCAIFLGSFLLFLVEPMAAKGLLPVFGGSAAVWMTCLVFFQMALLGAYGYADWQGRAGAASGPGRTERGGNAGVHLLLLGMAVVAAGWFAWVPGMVSRNEAHPVGAIFLDLGVAIGMPFLMLGATSPLLQVWLARIEAGPVPYRLFALSNLASLLALAAYPSVIEPNFTLRAQRMGWAGGFFVFAVLSGWLGLRSREGTKRAEESGSAVANDFESGLAEAVNEKSAPLRNQLLWVLLPMGAAMQLSAVTGYISANIAPIPLLWILPLGVYLVTLIVTFEFPRLVPRWLITRLLAVFLASLGYLLTQVDKSLPPQVGIGFFLLELLLACLFCHNEAVALRPGRTSESTRFYLLFAAGGALGSLLVGVVSPLVFRFNLDIALAFLVTAALGLAVVWPEAGPEPGLAQWGPRLLWAVGTAMMLVLVVFLEIANQRNTPVAVRNFYGALRVREGLVYPGAQMRTLNNGNIQHGTQIFSEGLRTTPTTYYAHDSGVGLAMDNCCGERGRNIGVIGLGAGTLAAYGRAGDHFRFYEINPAVVPIAQNLFTYMRDSRAQITTVIGDARASLGREPDQRFDVLVVDAFSGDAIPLHLLTREAMELYRRHLAAGGVLAFHISNQHVNLEPVVVELARSQGMQAMRVASPINQERGEFSATWMLVSADAEFFRKPEIFNHARKPAETPRVRLWTDDYSSLLPVLHW